MNKHKRPTSRDEARPAASPAGAADVASLINERRKIEEWIAALDAKREQTPSNAFTRVRADYEKRLRDVAERLAAHTGSLAEEQAGLKERLAAVDEEIREHRDERAEIDLRAHVGELAGSAVTAAYQAADQELARLAAERETIEADLSRVTEFFAAAGGGKLAPASGPSAPSRKSQGFDELSFLHSVVGEHDEKKSAETPHRAAQDKHDEKAPSPPAPKAVSSPTPSAASRVEPEAVHPAEAEPPVAPSPAPPDPRRTGELASIKSEAPTAPIEPPPKSVEKPVAPEIEKETEPLVAKRVERAPRMSIAMQQASMTIEPDDVPRSTGVVKADGSSPSLLDGISSKAPSDEKPFAANVASNNPLSLKSSGPSDVKTLKCRECGAMNDPTEWYCERCGAELSGL